MRNNQAEIFLNLGQKICDRFILVGLIGKGAFGQIYAAYDKQQQQEVALKIEIPKKNKTLLLNEAKIILQLQDYQGFPQLYQYIKGNKYNIIVQTLLGRNLENIFKKTQGTFQIKTVLLLGIQLLARLEIIHNLGYIHRDLKPDNILTGFNNKNMIYIIDYGLSKRIIDSNGFHIFPKKLVGMVGTSRFCSIEGHQGMEQSRKDDLESLGYVLIYLAKGKLPWMNLQIDNIEEKNFQILKMKINTSQKELCKNLPDGFLRYFQYISSLQYQDKPNYNFLRENCFGIELEKIGVQKFEDFEWVNQCINDQTIRPKSLKNIEKSKVLPEEIKPKQQQQQVKQTSEEYEKKQLMIKTIKFNSSKTIKDFSIDQNQKNENIETLISRKVQINSEYQQSSVESNQFGSKYFLENNQESLNNLLKVNLQTSRQQLKKKSQFFEHGNQNLQDELSQKSNKILLSQLSQRDEIQNQILINQKECEEYDGKILTVDTKIKQLIITPKIFFKFN